MRIGKRVSAHYWTPSITQRTSLTSSSEQTKKLLRKSCRQRKERRCIRAPPRVSRPRYSSPSRKSKSNLSGSTTSWDTSFAGARISQTCRYIRATLHFLLEKLKIYSRLQLRQKNRIPIVKTSPLPACRSPIVRFNSTQCDPLRRKEPDWAIMAAICLSSLCSVMHQPHPDSPKSKFLT